jgi:hypothetical protein
MLILGSKKIPLCLFGCFFCICLSATKQSTGGGCTPLSLASASGHFDAVFALIKGGADVNQETVSRRRKWVRMGIQYLSSCRPHPTVAVDVAERREVIALHCLPTRIRQDCPALA